MTQEPKQDGPPGPVTAENGYAYWYGNVHEAKKKLQTVSKPFGIVLVKKDNPTLWVITMPHMHYKTKAEAKAVAEHLNVNALKITLADAQKVYEEHTRVPR